MRVSYSGVRQNQHKARGLELADFHYAKLVKVRATGHLQSDALMSVEKERIANGEHHPFPLKPEKGFEGDEIICETTASAPASGCHGCSVS